MIKLKNQKLIFDILGKSCLHIPNNDLAKWLDVGYPTISAYRSEKRPVPVSSDEFFEKVFIRNGDVKEIEQKAIMQNICTYLTNQGLFGKRLSEYAALGYEPFIMALLSFDLDDIPEPVSEKKEVSKEPPVINDRRHYLNTVYPPVSVKMFDRKHIVNQIADRLDANGLILLHGIGGIGKSCITLAYIEKYKNRYQHIQHVYFEKSIKRTILKLSFYGLEEEDKTEDEKFHLRMEKLYSYSSDTLLVIDNMDIELEELDNENYQKLTRSKIHILITSRYTNFFEINENIIKIDQLSPEGQMDLFDYHYQKKRTSLEDDFIKKIFRQIDGHTLLIELIAKTMRDGDIDAQEMLDILDGSTEDTENIISIAKDQNIIQSTMDQYVNRLFDISSLDDEEIDTLRLLSLVPLEGISRKLFRKLLGKRNNTTISLTQSSWVITELDSGNEFRLRLHPIICRTVIGKTQPDFQNCIFFLNQVKAKLEEHNIQPVSDLNDLSNLVHNLPEVLDCRSKDAMDYLYFAACRLQEYCHYGRSLDILKYLIKCLDCVSGATPNHDHIRFFINVYVTSAQVYIRLADYKMAIRHYEDAIEMMQKDPQTNQAHLADLYNHLAFVYRKASEYGKALEYYNQAEKILRTLPNGENHPILGDTYNDLGIVYINQKDYPMALSYYQKGLQIREQHPETNRLKLAYSYHNIGTVYQRIKDFDHALEFHKKALEIRESYPDPPRLEIAASYAQIGNDYTASGNYAKAKEFYDRSYEIRKSILHPNHPDIAWILSSLGDWNYGQGKYSEAREKFQQVLDIRREALGNRHAYTAEALYKLGCCYRKLQHPQQAKKCFCEAEEIQEEKELTHALANTRKELEALSGKTDF